MSNHYTSPGSLLGLCATMIAVDTIVVILRFYSRIKLKVPILMDDWLIIPAWVFTMILSISTIVAVKGYAIGWPNPAPDAAKYDQTLGDVTPWQTLGYKIEWLNLWMQPLCLGCIKISIVLFYRRIFDTPKRKSWFHHAINGMLTLLILWTVAFFLAEFFVCGRHIDYNWGSYLKQQSCAGGHEIRISIALIVSDFCLDVLVMILPLPKIWGLHMSNKNRFLISGVFLIGAGAVVGSLIRTIQFANIQKIETKHITVETGVVAESRFFFWSVFETGVALVAACLPTIRVLLRVSPDFVREIRKALSFESLKSFTAKWSSSSAEQQSMGMEPISNSKSLGPKEVSMKTAHLERESSNMTEDEDLEMGSKTPNIITAEENST